ncbi:tRNA (5-methylaminomethyl-2-thiouridine)(34)-methyltransferase MnmD [Shewanella sp. VB17]|uniref:tRNA (5-methylaminomethyl-2-thiouridine)(34)-methyltransferase MnmD n=1 Tax=Shewanella sp. VB17 TaxID=2739432 RepID=UPI0015639740|nr:tRNA (5-methylaminomethyl-2-thiouridine)(34)-methyltransferase MnmD [Shewanella sp. VB17]NRD75521.1 tRNA (5-methylaminomethyl-2-thiouridine)(34)-methyltransferase MnmD [Shewanella sp. VB17]
MENKIQVLMTSDGSHTLMSSLFDDSYHAHNGAMSESRYVYIQAGLEHLSKDFRQVNLLELGFGTGMNAILTLESALASTGKIERPIHYTSVEAFPLSSVIIEQLNYKQQFTPYLGKLFDLLHQAPWDCDVEIIPGFTLHKVDGKLANFIGEQESINLVYYDGFAPNKQAEIWEADNFERLYPMMMQGGLFVSYCANGQFKRNLKASGFTVKAYPGVLGRREMTRAWKV